VSEYGRSRVVLILNPSARFVVILSHMKKISLKALVVYVACVVLVVGGRGYAMSCMVGGAYPWSAFLFDAFALLVLMGVLRGLDHIFQKAVRYGLDRRGWGKETRVQVARFAFILLFLLPFLLVTFQIHPQRIATTQDPGDFNLPFEEVELNSMGTILKGWYVPGARESGPVVLVTHGFGANKQNCMYPVILVHSMGLPALIVDFRAHGDGGLKTQMQSRLEKMSLGNWCRRKHRWDVPMGEVLQTSPWERSPNDGKSSYTGRA